MEPTFVEYLIKQTLMRPDRMLDIFLVLLAVLFLLLLVAIFRRPKHKHRPAFEIPSALESDHSSGIRKDLFSQSIPKRAEQTGANIGMSDLLDIEESLLALRELYQRQLIPAHVYIDESMKHSARLKY